MGTPHESQQGHNARIERLEQLVSILQGSSATISVGAATVVWRPGGVSAGNVYATWSEVVAAVAALNGAVTIGVDTTLAAATIPLGAWDLRPAGFSGPIELVNATPGDIAPFVTIANAAVTIHGLTGMQDIQLDNRSTSNVITPGAGDAVDFYLRGFASIFQSVLAGAGVSFIAAAGGVAPFDFMFYMQDASFVGSLDGGTNAIRVAAALSEIHIEDVAIFDANMLVSAAAATRVFVSSTEITLVGLPQYGAQASAPTIFPFGLVQKGTATLVAGATAAITAFIAATSRIFISVKDGNGTDAATAHGYAVLPADRVVGNPGSIVIRAFAGAVAAAAQDAANGATVDWLISN